MGYGAEAQGSVLTSVRACQIVPDIPSFAVDDGFTYLIPDGLDVHVGSRVRVRVSGRHLKGFVTALVEVESDRKLIPIEGLSGEIPSFDERMLVSLRWAAMHYVTPLSVVLKRTIPPNIAKHSGESLDAVGATQPAEPSPSGPVYRIGTAPYGQSVERTIDEFAACGRNVVVIAPTAVEIADIATKLANRYGERVVQATSSMSNAAVTKSWSRLATERDTILIGTREIMFWPLQNVGIVVVVEDGRRVMRSPGTPTLSVRDVMMRRLKCEGFALVFHGPVPTLEILATSALIEAPQRRQWPMVEVVDRTEEPPGGGLLIERTKLAIAAAADNGDSVFVLVGSRGYAPAFRCARCGEIRRCAACGSAGSRDQACRRCGRTLGPCAACGAGQFHALGAGIGKIVDDISGVVPATQVGRSEDHALVTVGTERDIIGVHDVGLAVAVDIDGLTMAPHYRAAEDGLRLAVRLAQTVRTGAGRRCMIQTAHVKQPAIDALLSGRSEDFLMAELEIRERFGFPPIGSLIAIETEGSYDVGALLKDQVSRHATVMGPAPVGDSMRWLVQARDLEPARLALRSILGTLRSKGAKVRVDVDPIDL